MKKVIEIDENEGLEKLMGKVVTLFCDTYIYTGELVGVNEETVLLKNPSIVYETGEFSAKEWKDAQKLPNEWYVRTSKIESFGILK